VTRHRALDQQLAAMKRRDAERKARRNSIMCRCGHFFYDHTHMPGGRCTTCRCAGFRE
jgi:hypothetical protein